MTKEIKEHLHIQAFIRIYEAEACKMYIYIYIYFFLEGIHIIYIHGICIIYMCVRKKHFFLLHTRWTSLSFRCPAETFSSPCQRWMSSPISAMATREVKDQVNTKLEKVTQLVNLQLHGQLWSSTSVKLP